ncbi:ABC transporter permease [bacterium]|nr:MAG: ABC transporter permease [bacterium]
MRRFWKIAITYIGETATLLWQIILAAPTVVRRIPLVIEQFIFMGIASLTIVLLTAMFTGMVTAFEAYHQVQHYAPIVYVGMMVTKAMMIELGPLITGLVLSGRLASSIAAELGTMKVTEQIDALEVMAINPIEYLVVPRVFTGMIVTPLLTILAEFVGVIGGYFVSRFFFQISTALYFRGVRLHYLPHELFGGLLKSLVFGLVISFMGCFHGLRTEGGAEGVGRSTTRAVVSSSILLLLADYLVARIVFS